MRFSISKIIILIALVILQCAVLIYVVPKLKEWRYWDIIPAMSGGGLTELVRPQTEPSITGSYLAAYVAKRRHHIEESARYYRLALKAAQKKAKNSGVDLENDTLRFNAYQSMLFAGEIDAIELDQVDVAGVDKADPFASLSPLLAIAKTLANADYIRAHEQLDAIFSSQNGDKIRMANVDALFLPFLKAWADAGREKTESAVKSLEATYGKLNVFQLFTFYQQALMWDNAGELEQALKTYQRVKDKTSLPYYMTLHLGGVNERLGQWEDAKTLYENYHKTHLQSNFFAPELVRVASKEPSPVKFNSVTYGVAETLLEAARMLIQGGFPMQGLAYAQMALYVEPSHLQASLVVAQALEQVDARHLALNYYDAIPASSGLFYKAQRAKAQSLFILDRQDEATRLLKDLLARDKQQATILISLADIYRQAEEFETSADYYRQAIDLLEAGESAVWQNYFAAGIAHERAKKWEQAETYLSKALELQPDRPEILNYLGYSWIDRGMKIEEGKVLIAQALLRSKNDPHIMDSMGWAHFLSGDYEKAVTYLEKAVETIPYDPIINEHLGDIYWKLGRYGEARFQWKKAVDYPDGVEPVDIKSLKRKIVHGLEAT